MKVAVYPADRYGCGHHRLIWPSHYLGDAGYDVTVVTPQNRRLRMRIDDDTDEVRGVELPEDVDVVVMQRVTHRYLAQAVAVLRAQGVAVVVDIDDDLTTVHPSNPAWHDLHPRRADSVVGAQAHMHSWHHLTEACRNATLVTVTTEALLRRYAAHGRGVVLPNYLAEHYYGVPHDDSDVVGWPASLHSHPNDPAVVGNAIQRLVHDGVKFRVTSASADASAAFGLMAHDVTLTSRQIELLDWPRVIAELGIGIAPLADTRFNAAKSWLKPLELAAVGVPWVASPRADYRRLHKLGCGVLVEKPREWYAVLRSLVRDESRRLELSDAGRTVASKLRLRDHAWRWWEAWNHALVLQRESITAASIVVS